MSSRQEAQSKTFSEVYGNNEVELYTKIRGVLEEHAPEDIFHSALNFIEDVDTDREMLKVAASSSKHQRRMVEDLRAIVLSQEDEIKKLRERILSLSDSSLIEKQRTRK